MEIKELIGLDVGIKRTGLARASSAARLAEPLKVVETADLIDELKAIIKKGPMEAIVVGLPRSLQGKETEQTVWVRSWVQKAKAELSVPFYWQDEALTSKLALGRRLADKKPQELDALAAQIILQDFLDTPEAERVVC